MGCLPPSRRYYEPLAAVATIEEVLAGPALRKLLFMTRPELVEGHLKPHWSAALEGTEAQTMQAVPDMLGECNLLPALTRTAPAAVAAQLVVC
jgi:hypothetical protein